MPTRSASRSTASTNVIRSIFWMNLITSPPSPQPKQWKVPCVGRTLNDGVFSLWNGQRPFRLPPPARRSATYSPTTSSIRFRSRTSAMSLSRIRPATATTLVCCAVSPRPVSPRVRHTREMASTPTAQDTLAARVRRAPRSPDRGRLPADRHACRRRGRRPGVLAAPGRARRRRPRGDPRPARLAHHGRRPDLPRPAQVGRRAAGEVRRQLAARAGGDAVRAASERRSRSTSRSVTTGCGWPRWSCSTS